MRLRRRHAWGAALIALFALPVLRPQGFAAVEDPPAGFFAWFAGVAPLNPRLWDRTAAPEGDSPRARELERVLAELSEARLQDAARADDLAALKDALELDRLPLACRARILRAHDPSPSRRSLLIDRGTEDGVEEGFPVVAGGVFRGRVQVARSRSALVRLVTDPKARLEVALRADAARRVPGIRRRRRPIGA